MTKIPPKNVEIPEYDTTSNGEYPSVFYSSKIYLFENY